MMARVTKDLGTSDAPAATRGVKPAWRDARLWIGVALVAGSIAIGSRVVAAADDTTRVWAARADLDAGARVTVEDLVPATVRLEGAAHDSYLPVDAPLPAADRLDRPVAAGELLPTSALGDGVSGLAAVPVVVPAQGVPGSLRVGSRVDIWVVTGDNGEAAAPVLDDVTVLELPAVDELLGAAGDRQIVVGVAAADRGGVGRVLAAGRDGRVSVTVEG